MVFFDDILVYSETLAEHVEHLKQVLQLLQQNQWKVKASKCVFSQCSIAYLGLVVNEQRVSTDPSKVQDVLSWSAPQNLKELRGFLQLSGYYRKFVCHYGIISQPLIQLLRKNVPFVWSPDAQAAFDLLKSALTSPVLALPNFSLQFTIETDACDSGVGAVLFPWTSDCFCLQKFGFKNKGFVNIRKGYFISCQTVVYVSPTC